MEEGKASYEILSRHYNGPTRLPNVESLSKGQTSKSLFYEIPIGTFSYQFGENPLYFVDNKEGAVYFRTADVLHKFSIGDFRKYGTFFGNDDRDMEGWMFAANDAKPAMFDEINGRIVNGREVIGFDSGDELLLNDGVIEGVQLKMHFPDKRDTPVELYTTAEFYLGPINKRGYWTSKAAEWRNLNLDFELDYRESKRGEFNPEAIAWMEHLHKESYKNPFQMIGHGAGIVREDAIAATFIDPSGYVYLVANEKFDQIIASLAEAYGTGGENALRLFKDYIIAHEIYHFFPKGQSSPLGNWYIEWKAGKLHDKFFKERKRIAGADDAYAYAALEKRARDYAKHSLVKSLVAEARTLGYEGSELFNYVSNKLAQYTTKEEFKGNNNESNNQNNKKTKSIKNKPSKQKNLEERVDEENKGKESSSKPKAKIYYIKDYKDRRESKYNKDYSSEEIEDEDSDAVGQDGDEGNSDESNECNLEASSEAVGEAA